MKLKEIKSLVTNGHALDITWDKYPPKGLTVLDVSTGVYGRNGLLLKAPDGQLYAVTTRNANCFRY